MPCALGKIIMAEVNASIQSQISNKNVILHLWYLRNCLWRCYLRQLWPMTSFSLFGVSSFHSIWKSTKNRNYETRSTVTQKLLDCTRIKLVKRNRNRVDNQVCRKIKDIQIWIKDIHNLEVILILLLMNLSQKILLPNN